MDYVFYGFPWSPLAFGDFGGVAEGQQSYQFHGFWDAQELLQRLLLLRLTHSDEAHPDALGPGHQLHLLQRPSSIQLRPGSVVHNDSYDQGSLTDEPAVGGDSPQGRESIPVLNNNKVPPLGVAGAGRPPPGLKNPVEDLLRNGVWFVVPHCSAGADALVHVHCHFPVIMFTMVLGAAKDRRPDCRKAVLAVAARSGQRDRYF